MKTPLWWNRLDITNRVCKSIVWALLVSLVVLLQAPNSHATDTSNPTIQSFTPSNGAGGVAINSNITIEFSESITAGVGSFSLFLSDSSTVVETFGIDSSTVTISDNSITLNPSNDFSSGKTYYLLADSGVVKDLSNNDFLGINNSNTYRFTTTDGSTPSIISVTSQTPNGTYGPLTTISIQITFSETMTVSGMPRILLETGANDRYANYISGSNS